MNELLFIFSTVFFLGAVLLIYRLFGKAGIYAYIGFASILANIQVTKSIVLFGLTTTAGSVLYASTFLCTDILSEKYGKKYATKGVLIGIFMSILWLIGTQGTVLLKPSNNDLISDALSKVLNTVPRITVASLVAYAVSQMIDVILYHLIWNKTGHTKKGLWIRNNGATLISQLIDSIIFVTIAFIGVYETNVFISILITTYVFKAIIALCDTPFIYLARAIKTKDFEEVIIDETR